MFGICFLLIVIYIFAGLFIPSFFKSTAANIIGIALFVFYIFCSFTEERIESYFRSRKRKVKSSRVIKVSGKKWFGGLVMSRASGIILLLAATFAVTYYGETGRFSDAAACVLCALILCFLIEIMRQIHKKRISAIAIACSVKQPQKAEVKQNAECTDSNLVKIESRLNFFKIKIQALVKYLDMMEPHKNHPDMKLIYRRYENVYNMLLAYTDRYGAVYLRMYFQDKVKNILKSDELKTIDIPTFIHQIKGEIEVNYKNIFSVIPYNRFPVSFVDHPCDVLHNVVIARKDILGSMVKLEGALILKQSSPILADISPVEDDISLRIFGGMSYDSLLESYKDLNDKFEHRVDIMNGERELDDGETKILFQLVGTDE
jgi:hypothetical protein